MFEKVHENIYVHIGAVEEKTAADFLFSLGYNKNNALTRIHRFPIYCNPEGHILECFQIGDMKLSTFGTHFEHNGNHFVVAGLILIDSLKLIVKAIKEGKGKCEDTST